MLHLSTTRNWSRFLSIAALALLTYSSANAAQHIEADHPNLQYTGRIDHTDPKAPFLSWPGTMIRANFTGDMLEVILDDDSGDNFFNVMIDGNTQYPFVIDCAKGEKTYQLGYALEPGTHSLEIYKRTEGAEGGTRFKGLVLQDGAELLPPPERPTRRIEFFGDSISSGMGNEGADNGPDHLPSEKNQYLAYTGFTARNLNAEGHFISKSGIGIMVSWFDFIMPQYYDQLSAVENNDTHWDFSQWTPDVVVINLFQNDCWLVDREKRLNPMPTEEDRIQAYLDFLQTIRKTYPDAYFVCALGSMDATNEGSKWPGYIVSAVEKLKKEDPSAKVDTFFFPFTGYGQHPRVKQHHDNAEKLSAFISEKMGW